MAARGKLGLKNPAPAVRDLQTRHRRGGPILQSGGTFGSLLLSRAAFDAEAHVKCTIQMQSASAVGSRGTSGFLCERFAV